MSATATETTTDTSSIQEQIKNILIHLPVNRTRNRTLLSNAEADRFTTALAELFSQLLEEVMEEAASGREGEEAKPRAMWHGVSADPEEEEITAPKKNDVLDIWMQRHNITDPKKVLKTRIGTSIYFYTHPSLTGAAVLYVVNEPNLSELHKLREDMGSGEEE